MSDKHVFIKNQPNGSYLMYCTQCGRDFDVTIQPPMSLDMAAGMMEQYLKEHKHEPANGRAEE